MTSLRISQSHTVDLYSFYSWKMVLLFVWIENKGNEREEGETIKFSTRADLLLPEGQLKQLVIYRVCSEEKSNYSFHGQNVHLFKRVKRKELRLSYKEAYNSYFPSLFP